jgi:hypothetical protein
MTYFSKFFWDLYYRMKKFEGFPKRLRGQKKKIFNACSGLTTHWHNYCKMLEFSNKKNLSKSTPPIGKACWWFWGSSRYYRMSVNIFKSLKIQCSAVLHLRAALLGGCDVPGCNYTPASFALHLPPPSPPPHQKIRQPALSGDCVPLVQKSRSHVL